MPKYRCVEVPWYLHLNQHLIACHVLKATVNMQQRVLQKGVLRSRALKTCVGMADLVEVNFVRLLTHAALTCRLWRKHAEARRRSWMNAGETAIGAWPTAQHSCGPLLRRRQPRRRRLPPQRAILESPCRCSSTNFIVPNFYL